MSAEARRQNRFEMASCERVAPKRLHQPRSAHIDDKLHGVIVDSGSVKGIAILGIVSYYSLVRIVSCLLPLPLLPMPMSPLSSAGHFLSPSSPLP